MAGRNVSCHTCSAPTAPSTARPSRVSGTSAFSTANATELAWSSTSCLANRSTQSFTNRLARVFTRAAYPETAAARLASRVRHALRPASGRPRRPPQARDAVRDALSAALEGPLRDPRERGTLGGDSLARAARGVRRAVLGAGVLFGVEKVFGARARARDGRRRAQEPHAGPAGREDRAGG